MEKSRSLSQQIIGHKMLFAAFLLFATDILATTYATNTTANVHINTSTFPASTKMATEISMTSLPNATTPDTLSRRLNTSAQPTLSFKETPTVLKQELPSAAPVNTPVPENTSSPMPSTVSVSTKEKHQNVSTKEKHPRKEATDNTPVLEDTSSPMPSTVSVSTKEKHQNVSTKEKHPRKEATDNTPVLEDTSSPMPSTVSVSTKKTHQNVSTKEKHPRTEATEVQESVQKEVTSKVTDTPDLDNKTVSSLEDLRTRSQGRIFEQSANATASLETTKSTEPKKDEKGPMPPSQAVPESTQTPKTVRHYTSGPFTTSGTHINNESISDSSDKRPSEKKHSVIILVVVLTILLLVGLLAFLCLRRRRHSGSTSFNSPEWAGQATLPDDTDLDKDVEQQAGSAGEGETRRGTLVTFFGKRQSKVPSIAMEDVNGKGDKGETEQLLCREAEIGSPSEATGDANGKVPEPLKGSSQLQ